MKCLSARVGPGFADVDDIRLLMTLLRLRTVEDVVSVISRFYPRDRFPARLQFVIEEALSES